MKIYNSVTIDMATMRIIDEDSFEYKGPISHCKGGSASTINSFDPDYNARMADISEEELGMAKEYFNFWQQSYLPYEQAQLDANMALIPQQTAAQSRMFQQAGNVNVGDRMDQASSDVTQKFGAAQGEMQRSLSRQGIQSGSGRSMGMERDFALAQAKGEAGARTQARRQGETDILQQLGMALNIG